MARIHSSEPTPGNSDRLRIKWKGDLRNIEIFYDDRHVGFAASVDQLKGRIFNLPDGGKLTMELQTEPDIDLRILLNGVRLTTPPAFKKLLVGGRRSREEMIRNRMEGIGGMVAIAGAILVVVHTLAAITKWTQMNGWVVAELIILSFLGLAAIVLGPQIRRGSLGAVIGLGVAVALSIVASALLTGSYLGSTLPDGFLARNIMIAVAMGAPVVIGFASIRELKKLEQQKPMGGDATW